MKTYTYEELIQVRFNDTDSFSHVNNAIYNEYFEAPRLSLLMYQENPLIDLNAYYVLRKIEIEYIKELTYPNIIKSQLSIKHIGTTSITINQAIYVGDTLISTATSTVVQLDSLTKEKKLLSDALKERLKRYML